MKVHELRRWLLTQPQDAEVRIACRDDDGDVFPEPIQSAVLMEYLVLGKEDDIHDYLLAAGRGARRVYPPEVLNESL